MSQGIISFDFDFTLTMPRWHARRKKHVEGSEPNWQMIDEMKKLHAEGYEIIITTIRAEKDEEKRSKHDVISVKNFVEKYELPVSRIYFVGDIGGNKGEFLSKIGGVVKHYDDNRGQLKSVKRHGIEPVRVFPEFKEE